MSKSCAGPTVTDAMLTDPMATHQTVNDPTLTDLMLTNQMVTHLTLTTSVSRRDVADATLGSIGVQQHSPSASSKRTIGASAGDSTPHHPDGHAYRNAYKNVYRNAYRHAFKHGMHICQEYRHGFARAKDICRR